MNKSYTVLVDFHTGESVAYGQYENRGDAVADAGKAREIITGAYSIKVVEIQPALSL